MNELKRSKIEGKKYKIWDPAPKESLERNSVGGLSWDLAILTGKFNQFKGKNKSKGRNKD